MPTSFDAAHALYPPHLSPLATMARENSGLPYFILQWLRGPSTGSLWLWAWSQSMILRCYAYLFRRGARIVYPPPLPACDDGSRELRAALLCPSMDARAEHWIAVALGLVSIDDIALLCLPLSTRRTPCIPPPLPARDDGSRELRAALLCLSMAARAFHWIAVALDLVSIHDIALLCLPLSTRRTPWIRPHLSPLATMAREKSGLLCFGLNHQDCAQAPTKQQ